ncbi:MAG TPA: hypothetical protein VF635_05205 [Propionibacteriaceae bacterium]
MRERNLPLLLCFDAVLDTGSPSHIVDPTHVDTGGQRLSNRHACLKSVTRLNTYDLLA